ncbi:MAG: ABC transporter permease subunit [Chloroflexota bacterium]|nr:ABC transporter permease subunit [Chloroflexota bacterium]
MRDSLLGKALNDLRAQVLGWGVGLGLLLAMTVALYPSISNLYGDMMKQLPEAMLAFFGSMADFSTAEGYLNTEFFSYGMLALAVFSIMAGTAALAGEEGDGTLEVLLAQPVSRTRLLLVKVVALIAATAGIIVITFPFIWVSSLLAHVTLSWGRLLVAFVLLWLFELLVALLAMTASLALGGRKGGGVVVAFALVASYIVDSLANLVSGLGHVRPLLLTTYYQGNSVLAEGVNWWYIGGLGGLLAATVVAALVLFQRKDVGVRMAWLPDGWMRWWHRGAKGSSGLA